MKAKPTLAYYATSVELHCMGMSYRGFFTNFTFTESADTIGWFNYDIKFKATLTRGRRTNFMPWHRSPYQNSTYTNSTYPWPETLSYNSYPSSTQTDSVSGAFQK